MYPNNSVGVIQRVIAAAETQLGNYNIIGKYVYSG